MQALQASRLTGQARPCSSSVVPRCSSLHVSRPISSGVSSSQELSSRSSAPATKSWRSSGRVITRATATAAPSELDDVGVSAAAESIIQYAINFARASETYEVHSWMVLMGILKYETCTAAKILKSLGLEDLYGAWNEVLWALNVCDGLQPRSFVTDIKFADRAFKVITAASDFAVWHGKDKMYSEDVLMALAAGGVLEDLFPDLNLSFERVRKAVEKESGRRYQLPDETEEAGPLKSEDDVSFL
ncbi:hypothetical protein CHLRE_03g144667v5 [Chlamydomonas reinhardtii]|uniref:ATP-dependent Clp protease ATP-binding subunit CLPT4, chloroplastic n=2 Tax=Chlamydomonas reinhardtii TaxID=3055 RepID=CLPT4_CHLRE|nr:uncharacterized protein CHLRE_03g144667v5 [Chlamydomonas reinhardtii]A8J353.1 RecName: Full=ATP-dependent Clp protease ATP-binding subunit CLPT4, chloroplastic; Flags: Precursor [Chlamydomonas reinhardtii]PNW84426.1 hypothetical protein CHLRE_03g144667v5 [Chlamydomonas reinhardtii]|eukprot:XP_001695741.1 ClpS-like protein [Chlamydomonas reinhardtii]